MADLARSRLLHRLRKTPMRDLVRGRVSGRLDVRARIASSDLPEAAKALVGRVVRKTRLWSLEKLDVADELMAHFRDGLESGAALDDLVNGFGNEGRAAKLIRRAKKRNRPLPWHIFRGLFRLVVAFVAFYIVVAVYFFAGRPSPSVNYVDLLNQRTRQAPPEQLAWPLYQKVIGHLSGTAPEQREWIVYPGGTPDLLSQTADDPRWPELVNYLEQHSDVLEMIRQASGKPMLGIVLTAGDYWKGLPGARILPFRGRSAASDQIPPLICVLLPHLNEMRTMAVLMAADARLARQQEDGKRLLRDIAAIDAMADQLRGDFLISDRVSLGIRSLALDEVDAALANAAQLLSDTDLQQVAHRLARPRDAAELFSFAWERRALYDGIQRMYTDDGHGDGRMTPEGIAYLGWASSMVSGEHPDVMVELGGPASIVAGASRREILTATDRLMDLADVELRQSARESKSDAVEQQLLEWKQSATDRLKYALLITLAPRVADARAAAERYLGRRDGAVTGIALELYRRQNGKYPEMLQELTPIFLPAVPVDRINGDVVRYRLRNGRPVVYSVGVDRDDDGGRPAVDRRGDADLTAAARWGEGESRKPDGDWILYPQSRLAGK